jgi:hypothetical protein
LDELDEMWPEDESLDFDAPEADVEFHEFDDLVSVDDLPKSWHEHRMGCPLLALVFRSFLTLSLVRGPWGHAGDAWFVDLGG